MRIATDGYIDLRDGRRVKTPGLYERTVDPLPEGEAVAFLLSHSFPGHRKMVRGLTLADRERLRMAMWADSVSARMSIVDRVWRSLTEEVLPLPDMDEPQLIQILQYKHWAYPVYLDGPSTRIAPPGGLPVAELSDASPVFRLDAMTA
ncbi:MAG: hypothetical protein OEZ65_04170 [Gemmatimonadota bacterium]|nr:hypothetical protein [Gemmatimonadota bacterium]MDH5758761.1 hypothetical protein [Gemmatimonadota bacterium]